MNQTGLKNVLWQSDAAAGGFALSALGGAAMTAMSAPVLSTPTLAAGGSLVSGTPYYWKASAVNAAGETVGSNQVTITPSGGNLSAVVSWAAVTGATSYRLFRSTVSGTYGASSLVATGITATSYTDTGAALSAGTLLAVATDGFLTLAKDPVLALHAATKQYVDAAVAAASTGSAGNGIVKVGSTYHFAQSAAYTAGAVPFAASTSAMGFDAANLFYDDANNRLGLLTNAPTHTLTLGSAASGLGYYETADQTINYSRVSLSFSNPDWKLATEAGGSAAKRNLLLATPTNFLRIGGVANEGPFLFSYNSNSYGGGPMLLFQGTGTATSGLQFALANSFTAQQSGTAGYTCLLIGCGEISTGSGLKLLADFQFGGVSRMRLNTAGALQVSTSAQTLNASALLQLDSTTSGLLLPRMTTSQRNLISSPATGLMIYNTDAGLVNYYSGSAWQSFTTTTSSGTVTSVGLSAPSFLTVTGSPITTSGTLALALANQSSNLIFAGPSTGSAAAPTFRAMVSADVPNPLALGAASADASAILDLTSTTKGVLTPRMTTTQRDAITSPATGLLIYNTTTNAHNFYNGSAWTAIGSGGFTNPMTSVGDIIVGGTAGAAARLAIGATNTILNVASGTPAWTNTPTLSNLIFSSTALSYAASVAIDFNSTGLQTISLTGNITFTTSNRGAGKSVTVEIVCDGTQRTLTFPAWVWLGVAPSAITASKTAILTLTCFGSNDTDVVAAYGEKDLTVTGNLSGLTSGGVLYATGANAAATDTTNFFWDATNKYLGIGTNAPATFLHVNSGAAPSVGQIRLAQNNLSSLGLLAYTTDYVWLTFDSDWSAGVWKARHTSAYGVGKQSTGLSFYGNTGLSVGSSFGWTELMRLSTAGLYLKGTVAAPTAYLHLGAGTASASTAPLKFTSGPLLTAAEAGAIGYNNDFYHTRSGGTQRFGLGGCIFDHYTDAGNTTTTETDLYSDTLPASLFDANGVKLLADYGGTFVASATATRQLKVYFGGTVILDTGALTISVASSWSIYLVLVRVSSSIVRYLVGLQTSSAALAAYSASGAVTGLTLTNTQILKITGQAAGTGAATNDIVAKLGQVSVLAPAA